MFIQKLQEDKYVNEFKILNNIGKGSFSKVKKVIRQWIDSSNPGLNNEATSSLFAMKVSQNFTLKRSIDDA